MTQANLTLPNILDLIRQQERLEAVIEIESLLLDLMPGWDNEARQHYERVMDQVAEYRESLSNA